jgi:hypothetical protein
MSILFVPVLLLFRPVQYLLRYCRGAVQTIEELFLLEPVHSRLDQLRQHLVEEIRVTLIYVSAAIVFTLLMTNDSIHRLTIFRWMIEASCIPLMYFCDVVRCYCEACFLYDLESDGSLFFYSEARATSLFGLMLRVTLFVLMRYTQLYRSSTLNDYQTYVFHSYCDTFNHHHVPADHRFRR